jgi:VanZ family protein
VPGLLWAVVILVLTGLPGTYFPQINSFWDWLAPDKMIHLFMFGSFTYLIIWGLRNKYQDKAKRKRLILFTVVLGTLYGGVTEILQRELFVGRDGNIFDFLANTLGGGFGILLFHMQYRKKTSQIKNSLK